MKIVREMSYFDIIHSTVKNAILYMKKPISILPIICIQSCAAPEKEEAAIGNFVQTFGNAKMDFDLKERLAAVNSRFSKVNRYRLDSLNVISKKYQAIYKVKHPMLGNVGQEITRVFYLTPGGNKVLTSE